MSESCYGDCKTCPVTEDCTWFEDILELELQPADPDHDREATIAQNWEETHPMDYR